MKLFQNKKSFFSILNGHKSKYLAAQSSTKETGFCSVFIDIIMLSPDFLISVTFP